MQHSKNSIIQILGIALLASLLMMLISTIPLHAQAAGSKLNSDSTPGTVLNTNPDTSAGQTLVNPLKFNTLQELLDAILDAIISLGTIILTLALMWTGFKFVAARGNQEKISQARTALMWTIVGGLILLGAKAIEVVISATVTSLTP